MPDQSESNNDHISSINPDMPKEMSRRDFLSLAGRTAIAGLAAVTIRSSQSPQPEAELPKPELHEPFEEYELQPTEVKFHQNSFFEFENGERSVNLDGMGWYPDGRVPFVTLNDGISKLMWVTGHLSGVQGSFPYVWNSFTGIQPYIDDSNQITPSVTREQNDSTQAFRNGYSGLTSVFPFSGGLLGFTHNEQWGSPNNGSGFKASIGIVYSQDGGKSFSPVGQPILGRETMLPGTEVTGAGQPCAVYRKDKNGQEYAYVYYTEWLPQTTKSGKGLVDQIYLARLPLNGNIIGNVEHFTPAGFKQTNPEEFADLMPVIRPPQNINSVYAALPSVSFDVQKRRFIATFETNVGVCACDSPDGVTWGKAELIIEYPNRLSDVWERKAQYSYSYPSLVDFKQTSDSVVGSEPTLLLAKGIGPQDSHKMVAINGRLKL